MKTTYEVYYRAFSDFPYQVVQVTNYGDSATASRFVISSFANLDEALNWIASSSEEARTGFGIRIL